MRPRWSQASTAESIFQGGPSISDDSPCFDARTKSHLSGRAWRVGDWLRRQGEGDWLRRRGEGDWLGRQGEGDWLRRRGEDETKAPVPGRFRCSCHVVDASTATGTGTFASASPFGRRGAPEPVPFASPLHQSHATYSHTPAIFSPHARHAPSARRFSFRLNADRAITTSPQAGHRVQAPAPV